MSFLAGVYLTMRLAVRMYRRTTRFSDRRFLILIAGEAPEPVGSVFGRGIVCAILSKTHRRRLTVCKVAA